MIDGRFSRGAFAAASRAEQRRLAAELSHEIRALIAAVPTADGAISSVLSRLRLVGHHLYPTGDGRFAGEGDEPTALVLQFGPAGVDVFWG